MDITSLPYLRTLLILARASNLPTVWSNCLAGWLLGGGGNIGALLLVTVGGTCLYVGGMFLNDAFDVDFDQQHRPSRPIPSGAITVGEVWGLGIGWMAVGVVLLFFIGLTTALLTICLLISILLYDWIHKLIAVSPVLMAACRFFLFLLAASAGAQGVTGLAIWTAFALSSYIIGLSYIAKSESTRGALKYWPCLFLAAPLFLAWLVNHGEYKAKSIVLSAILGLWIFRNLRFAYWSPDKNIGRTVSGLLAGIVLVDMLAVADAGPWLSFLFVLLFAAALLFQRFIPAT